MRSLAIAAVVTALVGAAGYAFTRGQPAAASGSGAPASELAQALGGVVEPLPNASDGAQSSVGRSEPPASAGKHLFYQWTDERGSVRFARSLEEVPAAWRERAGQVEIDASSYAGKKTRAATRGARGGAQEPVAYAAAAHDITVYTAPWCGWCRKTLAFLDERGVVYVNKTSRRTKISRTSSRRRRAAVRSRWSRSMAR